MDCYTPEISEQRDGGLSRLVLDATFPLFWEEQDCLSGIKGQKRVEILLSLIKTAEKKIFEPQKAKYWQNFPAEPIPCFQLGGSEQFVRVFASKGPEGKISKSLATIVSSTYPKNAHGAIPICDKSSALVFDEGRLLVITTADGCNWGEEPSKAAEFAVDSGEKGFLEELKRVSRLVSFKPILQDIGHSLMVAAHKAESEILKNCSNGTTTYLQTVVTARRDGLIFDICAYSIGDMKAYLFSSTTNTVVEITKGNRHGEDVCDPGGRLGRYPESSDLKNAQLFYFVAQKGDFLIQVSDGLHDCLEASLMGISSHLDSCTFAEALLQVLLKGADNPSDITKRLLTHAQKLTASICELMESDAKASQPADHRKFPGKTDHVLITVARIG